ncbi:PucR family transcriptional regulator [Oceanobacillus sp. FSL H7-0719]|uniref:PucR family transcriptional regulator n=1 Tax=Oceanobacillus sp. FSL H7-0719 TaxID=2954507 RepID=UPI003244DD14
MDYTIENLLKIDACKNASYIGDKEGLSNKVTGITVVDSPDISSWIKGGEVIVTSFFPIKGFSEKEMEVWTQTLAEKGISALIVKLRDVFTDIPKVVLQVCKKHSIPIIKIPEDTAFIDLTYPVMGQLFNQQVEKLKYFKEIHSRFTELSLQNVGSDTIIKTLEELIGNPVTIYNDSFQKIASTNSDVELFYDLDKEQVEERNFDTKFPIYRRMVVFPKLQERECEQILVPIKTIQQTKINLVVSAVNKDVLEYDFIAIENAATSLSLELVKQIAISEVEKKFKNDLIDDLISGKIKTMNTIYDRATTTQFDTEAKYSVVIFNLKSKRPINLQEEYVERHKTLQKHYELLANSIDFYLSGAIIRDRVDEIIVLWKVNQKIENHTVEINKIKQIIKHIRGKFKASVKDYAVQVGIGNISKSILDLAQSYNEAQDTLNIGKTSNQGDFIISFNDLGIYRLLYKFDDLHQLKDFIPASLQKLLDYRKANKDALIETLNVFLQCQQNIAKSAHLLYVHYKTVTYRLERIKEITGMNLDDSEEMLSVQVGLRIIDVLKRS